MSTGKIDLLKWDSLKINHFSKIHKPVTKNFKKYRKNNNNNKRFWKRKRNQDLNLSLFALYSIRFSLAIELILRDTLPFQSDLLKFYHPHLREWTGGLISQEFESFKKHNFRTLGSLLKVEVNKCWIKSLITKWDVTYRVFQFGSIDLCSSVEEYSIILEFIIIQNSLSLPFLIKLPNREHPKSSGLKRVF